MTEQEIIAKVLSIPSGYATIRLGMKLHPIQKQTIDSLFKQNKVIFCCSNEVGKTAIVSVASILYALEMLKAKVVYISATHRQVIGQLIPVLKSYSHLFPTWEFLENKIKINGIEMFTAFSTNQDSNAQGYHSHGDNRLLLVTDESAGIHHEAFKGLTRCNPEWFLITGSPLGPEGFFYENFSNPNSPFVKIKMNKFDALEENGWWLKRKDIEEFISMWGGNENPLVMSSVYGEFSANIENGIINLSELGKCFDYPPARNDDNTLHVGIDCAASGGDRNVMALRTGNKVDILDSWIEPELMRTCDRIAVKLNELKESHNLLPSQVSVDADGLGIGVVSRLKDLGWNVNSFHGGGSPLNQQYSNRISECWLEGIKLIKKCSVIIPNKEDIKLQLLSRKQLFNDKGKLKLESKKDMKAIGIKSPDECDAIFMAMSSPISNAITMVYKPKQPKFYTRFC